MNSVPKCFKNSISVLTLFIIFAHFSYASETTCGRKLKSNYSPRWKVTVTVRKEFSLSSGEKKIQDTAYPGIHLAPNLVFLIDPNNSSGLFKWNYRPDNYRVKFEANRLLPVTGEVNHVRYHPNNHKQLEWASDSATDRFILLHLKKLANYTDYACLRYKHGIEMFPGVETRGSVTVTKEPDESATFYRYAWLDLETTPCKDAQALLNEKRCGVWNGSTTEVGIFSKPDLAVFKKTGDIIYLYGIFREIHYTSYSISLSLLSFVVEYDKLGKDAFAWIEKNERCSETNQFTCTNGDCIALSLVCNDEKDCLDASDEENFYCSTLCPAGQRPCGIGPCILKEDYSIPCNLATAGAKQRKKFVQIVSGISIGFAVVSFGVITIYCWHTKKLKAEIRSLTPKEVEEFLRGIQMLDIMPPEVGTIDPVHAIPWDRKNEIPRNLVKIEREITRGHFGIILKAKLLAPNGRDFRCDVAVKMPIPSIRVTEFKALLDEVKIMSYIGSHENIVRFFGGCTNNIRKRDVLLIMEYCPNGCLLSYLQKNRQTFCSSLTEADVSERYANMAVPDRNFNTNTLLKWAVQTATGLEFLASIKVLHRDIAARNLLLSANLRVKIADFGLSRKLETGNDVYADTSSEVPWKWLAPEAFETTPCYSEKSDIWSFGVTLWEIFALGKVPYNGRQWDSSFPQELTEGLRLEKPLHASDELYNLMTTFWNLDPQTRPTFTKARESLVAVLKVFEEDSEITNQSPSVEYFQVIN